MGSVPADVHTNDSTSGAPCASEPDRSLRLMLTWVGIALVVAVLIAFIGVELAFRLFDR